MMAKRDIDNAPHDAAMETGELINYWLRLGYTMAEIMRMFPGWFNVHPSLPKPYLELADWLRIEGLFDWNDEYVNHEPDNQN